MKKERLINFRSSEDDIAIIEKAVNKLSNETGEKPNVSKALRHSAEHYATSEPEMFFCNRLAIEEITRNIEISVKYLQDIIDEYKAIAEEIPTIEEIRVLYGTGRHDYMVCNYENLKEQIYRKLHARMQNQYKGLVIIRENIVIPDFDNLVEVCSKLIHAPWVQYREVFYWSAYQVIEGKISVDTEQVEKAKSQYRCYAVTNEEIERLNIVRKICRLFDAMKHPAPEKLNIQGVMHFDAITNRFEPLETWVKFGIS